MAICSQDQYIDKFFLYCNMIDENKIPARLADMKMEAELKKS